MQSPIKSLRLLCGCLIPCALVVLQGCVAAVTTGAVVGAATVVDRRSTGTFIDDEIIELKILDVISKDRELWDRSHVNATSYNNVVLLTGEAPNETLRVRLETLVKGVQKVRAVHNELAIAAPSSALSRSSDSVITGRVKTSIIRLDVNLAARTKVITENGVVFLMGLVSREEADTATNVARQVGGVQRVVKVFEYLE